MMTVNSTRQAAQTEGTGALTRSRKRGRTLTGRELKLLRQAMGMTQQELASKMGVSREAVARWEIETRGISQPMTMLIRMLAAQYNK